MKGIILHGGHGTRLRPLTHTGPKQLLPIANKPMSQYCLEAIAETGITDIAIIIGGVGSNKVREYYGDGTKFGVNITYIEQDEPRGIAHAIRLCKDFIHNEKFLVFLGDNIIQKSISDFVEKFKKTNSDATVLLCEVDNPSQFGIADVKNGKIQKITEKPKEPTSNLAVTGIYFLTPLIFEIIDNLKPSWRNELEITDALDELLKKNDNISFERITDYWKDTGTPEDIIHANGEIISKHPEFIRRHNPEKIILGKNLWIDTAIKLKGPVIIGDNCKIYGNSLIGPNVSVGDNSDISVSAIENSIIMDNCKIDSRIKIKNSIVASNSEIKENSSDEDKNKYPVDHNSVDLHDGEVNTPEKFLVFLLGEGSKVSL